MADQGGGWGSKKKMFTSLFFFTHVTVKVQEKILIQHKVRGTSEVCFFYPKISKGFDMKIDNPGQFRLEPESSTPVTCGIRTRRLVKQ